MKTELTTNSNGDGNWNNLESLEREVRKKIGGFRGTKFSQAARWLERTDDLQRKRDALKHELNERLREGRSLLNPVVALDEGRVTSALKIDGANARDVRQGGKARGRECRAAYVTRQSQNGQSLTRVRGALYRNGNGIIVGIAYAMASKNKWFLGLPAEEFKEAVLLCETAGDRIQPIHLSKSFIERFSKHLPVSTQFNQAKFNVACRASRYYLSLKGSGEEDLTDYLEQSFVCPRTEQV